MAKRSTLLSLSLSLKQTSLFLSLSLSGLKNTQPNSPSLNRREAERGNHGRREFQKGRPAACIYAVHGSSTIGVGDGHLQIPACSTGFRRVLEISDEFPTKPEDTKRPDKPPPILTILPLSERGRSGKIPSPRSEDEILSSPHLKALLFSELKNATRNFRPDGLLGEGGFGCVYKGWLDEQALTAAKPGCGIAVAVKKLKPQGYQGHKEWLSEVDHLGQLHHPNLVKLIGYCLEDDNRLLVYEFMARGSLENHLFKRSAQPLPWETRVKVAIDAARGLSFLHNSESQVIYRDLKASNVLLDSEFNAKLSDFGLAKAGPTGDQTHVSTQVMGTHGYAAPEYVATGRLTAKCDVYSFGVVLLELLSGRRAVDKEKVGVEQKLVDWAKSHLDDKRKIFRLMDTKLGGQYPRKGALILATLGMSCVNLDSRSRPPMDEVLRILEKIPSLKCVSVGSPWDRQTLPCPVSKSPRQLDLPSPITPNTHESLLPSPMIPTGTMIIGR